MLDANGVATAATLRQRLEAIRAECEQLSREHRLGLPPDPVASRLHDLVRHARILFQDWSMEICFLLDHHRVLRFTQLMRGLPGISSRTLSARLTQLQEWGFMTRTFYDENPPHVEYRLTSRGRGFVHLAFPLLIHIQGVLER